MNIQLIRHATLIISFKNKKILVDPLLSPKGSITAIENVPNKENNPLVDLPVSIDSILDCDAVLVTHTHRDHFDDLAARLIPKNLPIFCQPEDENKLCELGFLNVLPVCDFLIWDDIKITRTGGKHGHGALALKMAPVSGFIISANGEPSTYIMGDTVWCSCVKKAILKHQPAIAISFCGEARFSQGKAITMNAGDIHSICSNFPSLKVISVHMEAWNHCRLSRKSLQDFVNANKIEKQVYIPADGESLNFILQ